MATIDQLLQQHGPKPVEASPQVGDPITTPTPDPTPTPTPPPAPPPTPVVAPEPIDKMKIVGEVLGQTFASEDEFTAWRTGLTETQTKLQEAEARYTQLQQEKEALTQSFDPQSLFASPELFVLNGLLKKFPDKNPTAMAAVATKDFSKTYLENPIDVLALDMMLENPDIFSSKADADEYILKRYDVLEVENIDASAKKRMQVDAKLAVEKFTALKKQIEMPASVDLSVERQKKLDAENEKKQKMMEATEPLFTKIIPESLKEVEIIEMVTGEDGKDAPEVMFKYEIGESFPKSKLAQSLLTSIRDRIVREGTEWTPAKEATVRAETVEMLKALYMYQNKEKVFAAHREDLLTKYQDETWMKRHNVRQLKQVGSPAKPDEKAAKLAKQQEEFLKAQGIKT